MLRERSPYRLGRKDLPVLLGLFGVLILLNVLSWRLPFFWDNILNSKIAHWYLDSGFSSLTVPEQLDAGHPPFFSLYIAVFWSLFGKSLAAAHIAMLPFLLLLATQFYKLARRLLPAEYMPWALAFLVFEPTFLAQSTMVTPDIALVCFYLLGLNAILDGRRILLAIAMIAMAAVTFRGILAVPALFLTDILVAWAEGQRRPQWLKAWPYVPVTLLTLLWLWIHYKAVGWIFSPPPETYGGHREMVGLKGILRNLGITGWRFLDYGRVALWLFVLIGFFPLRKHLKKLSFSKMAILFLVPAATFTLLFIPFSNPIGHRYFMVCFLIFGLLAASLLGSVTKKAIRGLIGAGLVVTLISGHFWVYPDHIAKGWDAHLAHVSYFDLMADMRAEIRQRAIDPAEVCSGFPMLASERHALVKEEDPFGPLQSKDALGGVWNCKFVLYSNISNEFSEADLANLENRAAWRLLVNLESGPIKMRLYHRMPSPF